MEEDITKENFIDKWPVWIRWILFLPVAIFCSILAGVFYNVAVFLSGWFFGMNYSGGFYWKLMDSAIFGGVFVYVGTFVAPKYQFGISIMLLVLLTFFLGFLFLYSLVPGVPVGPINFIVNALFSLIAGGYVVFYFGRKEH